MKLCPPALIFGLFVAMGFSSPASASAAAAAAVAIVAASATSSNISSTVIEIPEGSDGYVKSTKFYRDGPHYRFCREDSRVVFGKGCIFRQPIESDFFGLKLKRNKRTLVGGMSSQELLDDLFGPGATELTRQSVKDDAVVYIFYKVKTGS